MEWIVAKKSVDLLVQSPGKDKFLALFGGEPLLNFELIKKIVPYAQKEARRYKRNLTISLCTNGTLLTPDKLKFFQENDVKVEISLVGAQKVHDKFRIYATNRGSYEIVKKNLDLVFKYIPQRNLGVSFCIFPSLAQRISEDFHHILKLGFNYFNFEIIRDFEPWTSKAIANFNFNLQKICEDVLESISQRRFIFLNPVNWELKYKLITRSLMVHCPFEYELDIYPSGEMAFSPFLLNLPEKRKYLIGNVKRGFKKNYQQCQFNRNSIRCQTCEISYYQDNPGDRLADLAYQFYHDWCFKIAKKIEKRAQSEKNFSDYLQEIKTKICF
jgi:uncharacterized protein